MSLTYNTIRRWLLLHFWDYLISHLIPHVHFTTSVHAPHVTFNDHLSSHDYLPITYSHLFYRSFVFIVLAAKLVVVHQYSMEIQFFIYVHAFICIIL